MKLIWRTNSLQDVRVLCGIRNPNPNPNPNLHLDGTQAICCCRRTCPEPSPSTSLSLSFSGPRAQPQDGGVILDASGSTDQHAHPQRRSACWLSRHPGWWPQGQSRVRWVLSAETAGPDSPTGLGAFIPQVPFWTVLESHLKPIKNKREYTLFPIEMLLCRFLIDLFFTKT